MRKAWLFSIFLCFQALILSAQEDSVTRIIDSVGKFIADSLDAEAESRPVYEYWKKDYFNNIKRVDTLAQPKQQSFSEMIGKYQSKEYEYIESISDKLTFWKSIKSWINKYLNDLFPNIEARPAEWFYDLLGLAGAVLVLFLLYKFFFSGKQFILNQREEMLGDEDTLEFVEKNLLEIDINTYIKIATDSNNYPLAIRYQQLLNIQLLAKNDIITWDQAKTNMELTNEIKQEDIRLDFKKCTFLFDYVWFGDFKITATKFEEISKQFQDFQRRWS